MIQDLILYTNITRIVWQTVRRITTEILVVKGLNYYRGTMKRPGQVSHPTQSPVRACTDHYATARVSHNFEQFRALKLE